MSHHDASLPNRPAAEQHMDALIGDVSTAALGGFATLVFALESDGAVSAALLKTAAANMLQALRESDYLARLDGNEFLVLIPQVSDDATARRVADKLVKAIAAADARLATSIGVSMFPKDGRDRSDLLAKADSARTLARRAGRNQTVFTS